MNKVLKKEENLEKDQKENLEEDQKEQLKNG